MQPTETELLREAVEALAAIERGSASPGEHEAAKWIKSRLEDHGLDAQIDTEDAHGTYWWPIIACAAAATVGGIAALKGRRRWGSFLAFVSGALIWDDLAIGRRPLRKAMRRKKTYNVWTELGPKDASKTVVLMSHHDAAHAGLLFHPEPPKRVYQHAPQLIDGTDKSPPVMWPIIAGPLAILIGSLLNSKRTVKAGLVATLGTKLIMGDIAFRKVVPGANDNATGVAAVIGVAKKLKDDLPEDVRVIVLSNGSEEAFLEGSEAFLERYKDELPKESTVFIAVDTLGCPHLACPEAEGYLIIDNHSERVKHTMQQAADNLGLDLWRGLVGRSTASDAYVQLRKGYETALLTTLNEYKSFDNYHWPTDVPEHVDYERVSEAVDLLVETVKVLAEKPVAAAVKA